MFIFTILCEVLSRFSRKRTDCSLSSTKVEREQVRKIFRSSEVSGIDVPVAYAHLYPYAFFDGYWARK